MRRKVEEGGRYELTPREEEEEEWRVRKRDRVRETRGRSVKKGTWRGTEDGERGVRERRE